jgi:NAD(P)-dependent dehydrogenase (short-subunit alcohol dehydrogenase family)
MESVRKAFKEAIEKYGCVDILVNNAGISENTSFMDYTEETFDKVLALYQTVFFYLAFVKYFLKMSLFGFIKICHV